MDDATTEPHSASDRFDDDVKLFACNLIASATLSFEQFQRLVEVAPDEGCGLLEFAQLIIDEGISSDGQRVQEILYQSCDEYDDGERATSDPFARLAAKKEPKEEEKPRSPLRLAQPGVSQEKQEDKEDASADSIAAEKEKPKIILGPESELAPLPSVEEPEPVANTITPVEEPQPEPELAPAEEDASDEQPKARPYDSEPVRSDEPRKPISLGASSAKTQQDVPSHEEESPTSSAGDEEESLEDLAALAAQFVEQQDRPARRKRTSGESRSRSKVQVDAGDVETIATAAVASLGSGSDGGASMGEAAPAAAQSKAEKPSENIIAAKGSDVGVPDFDRMGGLDANSARSAMISLLLHCAKRGYSDLHISADSRPFARKHGKIEYLGKKALSESAAEVLNQSLLSPQQLSYFKKEQDFDFAIPFDTGHRFRTNFMIHKDGVAGTYRIVPDKPLPIGKLGFTSERSELIKKLLAYHNGLILVTGPVGSGKTTTLASLVHEMNQARTDHVICVEEPIEIVHNSDQCSVTQRGVGPHTNTFHSALKGALRQDPDIIVIGEMRDLETIEMAISASETGHLVIGTMHTSDASNTLNRLLDVFPPAQQPQIRAMVAESLKGIVCQRLLPSASGGLVLACELLLNNSAVASLIREGKSQGLANVMETGKREGMILMDNSVIELFRAGKISEETAKANIKNEMILRQLYGNSDPEPEDLPEPQKKGGLFRR